MAGCESVATPAVPTTPVDAAAVGPDAAATPDAAAPEATTPRTPGEAPHRYGITLGAHPQQVGDPAAGRIALLTGGYVTCGVPYALYEQFMGPVPSEYTLPERGGKNATLPYWFTVFETKSGVEVVAPNCLTCHATLFRGEIVLGLGEAMRDYTEASMGDMAQFIPAFFAEGTPEYEEATRFAARVAATAPYVRPLTAGVNPADNLAAALFAHRDPETLAWSDELLLDPPPTHVIPVDVPPWWRMKKKHAMFYTAAGRGDHARIMSTASTLCTDSVEEAQAIGAYFDDVRTYIESLEPLPYPDPVDTAKAAIGKPLFEEHCAQCHGTYGDEPTYPNLVVDVEVVGTDSVLATGASQFADRFVEWFAKSWYGQTAWLEPEDGYVPPPLDGVWVTGPFLHNGSVPTLGALLDSSLRPTYWKRTYANYKLDTLGLAYTEMDHGQDDEADPEARKLIYDTTKLGYGNGGHTFGDLLTPEEREALLEYLKTI
jgi:mono/diheme cytochrome c family protein